MDGPLLTFAPGVIEDYAVTIRHRAAVLGAAAASVRWRSPAARVFLARSDAATMQLVAVAQRIDTVAELVRAHAIVVAAVRK